MQSHNHSPISLTQATLFVAVSVLAIAAIGFQLGKRCFQLGQSTRKGIDALDGTGGPLGWIQWAYLRLRPKAFITQPQSVMISSPTDTTSQQTRPDIQQEDVMCCDLPPASTLTCALPLDDSWLNRSTKTLTQASVLFEQSLKLERLSVRELRIIAKDKGIKAPHKLKKAELIYRLSG